MWNELHSIEGHGHSERVALVPPIPINVANCIKSPRSIWSHRSPTPSSPIKVVWRILWCNHPNLATYYIWNMWKIKSFYIIATYKNLSWKFGNINFNFFFKPGKNLPIFWWKMFFISQNHFCKFKFVKSLLVKNIENPIDPSH
jgi:hypothetical protein